MFKADERGSSTAIAQIRALLDTWARKGSDESFVRTSYS